jgi:hypothetical protein
MRPIGGRSSNLALPCRIRPVPRPEACRNAWLTFATRGLCARTVGEMDSKSVQPNLGYHGPSRHHGTCYRASNWTYVGHTRGFTRLKVGFAPNHRPKAIFVYELVRRGIERLRHGLGAPS